MKIFNIVKDIFMILTLIYLCIIITLNFNRNDLANVAFNIALMSEREWLNTQDRLRTWEHLIDGKMEKCDDVNDLLNHIGEMEWREFKRWKKRIKKK